MELSAAGLALIKQSEGFRATTYRDVAGFPTIGYGHLLRPGDCFPAGVTKAEAEALLAKDVAAASTAIFDLVRVALSQGQFDALVDFTFNLGAGRLAGSTLLKELNAGRYVDAGYQLLSWDHAAGVVNYGLKARRQAEFQLWTGPAPAAK